jgi:hypothetical protein
MTYIITAIVAIIVVVSGGFAFNQYYSSDYEPIDIEIAQPKERSIIPFVNKRKLIPKSTPTPRPTSIRPTPTPTRYATPTPTPVTVDRTAPTISGVGISSITTTGATISWTTNEASNTQVEYGLQTTYGSLSSLNSTLSTSHSLQLSGLTANRVYHVRARSTDAAGNLALSGDYTFSTPALPTVKKVDIDDVEVESITSTSAKIKWDTEIDADGKVEYGTTTAYASSTTLLSTKVTSHEFTLSSLLPNTTYHYRVRSKTSSSDEEISRDYTFKTLVTADTTAPGISAISVTDITQTSAKINWTTNETTDASVEWGLNPTYGTITPNGDTSALSHSVSLTGLEAGKTYNYRVISKDSANNTTRSANATFITTAVPVADTTAPVIENVQIDPNTTTFDVSWTTTEASDSLIKFRPEGQESWGSFSDGARVTTHAFSGVGDLQPGVTYEVELYSTDAANNISEKVTRTIQTLVEETVAP